MIEGTDVLAAAAEGLVIARREETGEYFMILSLTNVLLFSFQTNGLLCFGRDSHVIGGCTEPLCSWQQPPRFVTARCHRMELI